MQPGINLQIPLDMVMSLVKSEDDKVSACKFWTFCRTKYNKKHQLKSFPYLKHLSDKSPHTSTRDVLHKPCLYAS